MMITRTAALATALAVALLASAPAAAKDYFYSGFFSNVAVGGHDPVAYFTDGKPVEGSSEFTTEYKGATFRFATRENLEQFEADPDRYAPQYGGYCAWAVSQGYTAPIDPAAWKIVDGKLYLNYNDDIQQKWEQDIPGFIESANANWPSVID